MSSHIIFFVGLLLSNQAINYCNQPRWVSATPRWVTFKGAESMDDTMQPQARHFPRCIGGVVGWLLLLHLSSQYQIKVYIYIWISIYTYIFYICIDESKSPQVLQENCFLHHLVHQHHSKCKFFAILQLRKRWRPTRFQLRLTYCWPFPEQCGLRSTCCFFNHDLLGPRV